MIYFLPVVSITYITISCHVINPRHAWAVWVTVLGLLVCLSVSLSVTMFSDTTLQGVAY